jgi:transcriptional regulator with XRE-family HTH domain
MSNTAKCRFGAKIRAVREKRGMTMKSLAEAIGVTESLISQIERDKVSPAVDTLFSITETLNIDFDYIFADIKKIKPVQIVRKDDRARFETSGIVYEQLSNCGAENDHGIESYYLEIAPGGEKGSGEYGHIGMEMGIIISGKCELEYGTERYPLASGDSVSFSSDIPHVLRNMSSGKLKCFWVVTPPKGFFGEM